MTRLTNYIADKIVNRAVEKAGFAEEYAVVRAAKYELAEDMRIASLGGAEEARRIETILAAVAEQLSRVPENIQTARYVGRKDNEMCRMNLGGARVTLRFSDDAEDKRVCAAGVTFSGDSPLVQRFHDLAAAEEEIENRESALRQQIRVVVRDCSTIKKLLQVWPEAKELLPEQLEEARPQLPAVPVAQLNVLLGLPSE